MDMMNTLNALAAAFGPAGDEGEVSRVIEKLAAPYVDEISRDVMGNLICRRKGSGPRVMFAAHMDTIGLVATHIEDGGFVHMGPLGGIHPAEVLCTPVRFKNGVHGVVCAEAEADVSKLKSADLLVDLGASSKEEAEKLVKVGDAAVFDTPIAQAGDRVIAPYLDDRAGCLVLLLAMEQIKGRGNDLYFVFTAQEEVGSRGAKTAAWAIAPDYGVAVDVTADDDEPGSKHRVTSQCGRGAAVKVMDSTVICQPEMVEKLMGLAQGKSIPAQRDVIRRGGTDGGPIHLTRGGVYTGGISIPCRYAHSPAALADLNDVKACADLAAAFAEAMLEKEC